MPRDGLTCLDPAARRAASAMISEALRSDIDDTGGRPPPPGGDVILLEEPMFRTGEGTRSPMVGDGGDRWMLASRAAVDPDNVDDSLSAIRRAAR